MSTGSTLRKMGNLFKGYVPSNTNSNVFLYYYVLNYMNALHIVSDIPSNAAIMYSNVIFTSYFY